MAPQDQQGRPRLSDPRVIENISGPQKAAILLVSLGVENSLKILSHLTQNEVEEIGVNIASVPEVLPEVRDAVMEEFLERSLIHSYIAHGGVGFAQEILERRLGPQQAQEILRHMTSSIMRFPGIDIIQRADIQQILEFVSNEHPQTIAFLLTSLPPEKSGPALAGLPPEIQADVAMRIAVMEKPSDEIMGQLDRIVLSKMGQLSAHKIGGVKALVNLLREAGRASEKLVIGELEKQRPDMAEDVKKLMFVFEDMVLLDNRSIQRLLREVEAKDLSLALKGAPKELIEVVERNLSERARTVLREDMEALGAVPMKQVERAQQKIVGTIRRLEELGEITVGRGKGEALIV